MYNFIKQLFLKRCSHLQTEEKAEMRSFFLYLLIAIHINSRIATFNIHTFVPLVQAYVIHFQSGDLFFSKNLITKNGSTGHM